MMLFITGLLIGRLKNIYSWDWQDGSAKSDNVRTIPEPTWQKERVEP